MLEQHTIMTFKDVYFISFIFSTIGADEGQWLAS
jgi:hypothetical protein